MTPIEALEKIVNYKSLSREAFVEAKAIASETIASYKGGEDGKIPNYVKEWVKARINNEIYNYRKAINQSVDEAAYIQSVVEVVCERTATNLYKYLTEFQSVPPYKEEGDKGDELWDEVMQEMGFYSSQLDNIKSKFSLIRKI